MKRRYRRQKTQWSERKFVFTVICIILVGVVIRQMAIETLRGAQFAGFLLGIIILVVVLGRICKFKLF